MNRFYIVKQQYGLQWYWNRHKADWDLDVNRASIYGEREYARVVSLGDNATWLRVGE